MKKVVSRLLVLLVLLAFSVNAMAAEFTPSVTNKGAPEVVTTAGENGEKVIGNIVDNKGNVVSTANEDSIVITSVANAETSTEIPADSKTALLNLYEEMNKPDTKMSEIFTGLANADNMVVRDLFDITTLSDELKTNLAKDGNSIDLTFDLAVGGSTTVTTMMYVNGAWKQVATKNNGNGTVTATFEQLDGPVAFLVPAAADSVASNPKTADTASDSLAVWGVVMGGSVLMAAALLVFARKQNAEN